MDVWDLETKNKDCSVSIGNPGFCRLATFTTFEGGMLNYSTVCYTCNVQITTIILQESQCH